MNPWEFQIDDTFFYLACTFDANGDRWWLPGFGMSRHEAEANTSINEWASSKEIVKCLEREQITDLWRRIPTTLYEILSDEVFEVPELE
jgi:hypothetical protein